MVKIKSLGEFEILVLTALIRLGSDAYGVSIRREIEARAKRTVTVGALHTTLTRMEDKGLVTSQMGQATAARGGRAKRHYAITPSGRAQLEHSLTMLKNMLEGTQLWPEPS